MTNKSQILYNIFQEILAASGNSSDSQSINETKILSLLREQASRGQGNNLGSILVKVVSDAQSKLNLTIKPDPCSYCDGDFRQLIETYNGIHGYVSLLVCTIGVLANSMNIAVLTRKDMAAAPINRLLKWLAVADVFVMVEYVPFAIYKYLVFDIHTKNVSDVNGNPDIAYHVDSDSQGTLYQINFWVHGVIIKLLPCSILTVISLWLIGALYSANQHQKNLRNYSACPAAERMVKRQHKADKRTDRTTKMLLAVLLLFLVTELPQGIMGLMSGLLGPCFFKRCYNLFGEIMDMLALVNGAINFILYCSMSRQFRQTFRQLLLQRPLARFLPPAASHSESHNQNT
ncbi:putative G-protein coupled receptor B0563.6 [Papilio machaon]|uniref:Putative G-protein coupled receptor B0563.6 n=1 Tax=Papilio machaon TaxID=76193 RepID=A0A194QWF3_PAPMA|nr:putative G-protein coupled receptor B0563.6 [Papilio machaon]